MQELGSATENQSPYPGTSLIIKVVAQVSGKRYAPTRAWTKDFVIEVWCFAEEAKMSALQNRTGRNYVISITYQVLSLN